MKLIEHTFGRFKVNLHWRIYDYCLQHNTTQPGLPALRNLCRLALETSASADVIKRDAASLPATLQIIAHDKGVQFSMPDGALLIGSGGDWAPRRFR